MNHPYFRSAASSTSQLCRPSTQSPAKARMLSTYPSPARSESGPDASRSRSHSVAASPAPSAMETIEQTHQTWYPASPLSNPAFASATPSLHRNMAHSGLGVDLSMDYEGSWSRGASSSCDASMTATTISPSALQRHDAYAPHDIESQHSSYSSSCYPQSDAPSFDDVDLVQTPEPVFREHYVHFAHENNWFSAAQLRLGHEALAQHEQCHLALSDSPEPLRCGEPNGVLPSLPVPEFHNSTMSSFCMKKEEEQSADMELLPEYGESDNEEQSNMKMEGGGYKSAKRSRRPKFACQLCGKLFMRTFNYNAHMETHNPDRSRPHACSFPGCDKSFFRITDLKRHDQSVHLKSKEYRCKSCGAGFPRKDSLQRHRHDGCAHRSAVAKKMRRQWSRSSDEDVKPQVSALSSPRLPRRSGSLGELKDEYLSRSDALALARCDTVIHNPEPERTPRVPAFVRNDGADYKVATFSSA